ncbi:hypothetical protein Dimus_039737 [Dionaea muscipula]
MAKECNVVQPKLTLVELGKQLFFSQSLQSQSQVLGMLNFTFGVDQDIINEDHNELVQIGFKNPMYQIHERRRGISQPEWHDLKLIMPVACPECRLGDVPLLHLQLVISRFQVNLGENLNTLQLIKQFINPRQQVLIFYRHFVKLTVVNAQPHDPVLLHKQNRGSP